MALSVRGKYALVTGGGSGISLGFCRRLLQEGSSVIIGDLRLSAEAQALLDTYPHPSADGRPSALFHPTDVTSWPQLSSLWKAALEAFPTIDIVVPGAGLYDPPWSNFWAPPRTETNPDTPSRDPADAHPGHYSVLDVNLVSPIRLSQLAIAHWTQHQQKGCLVSVGSVAGYLAEPTTPLYFASKHGLHGFVQSLAELRDQLGIRVGCVAPGPVKIWDSDPARSAQILKDCQWVAIEDIAEAMFELVVNEAYGNGTILEVVPGGTRVVCHFETSPLELVGSIMPGVSGFRDELFQNLKTKGLKA